MSALPSVIHMDAAATWLLFVLLLLAVIAALDARTSEPRFPRVRPYR